MRPCASYLPSGSFRFICKVGILIPWHILQSGADVEVAQPHSADTGVLTEEEAVRARGGRWGALEWRFLVWQWVFGLSSRDPWALAGQGRVGKSPDRSQGFSRPSLGSETIQVISPVTGCLLGAGSGCDMPACWVSALELGCCVGDSSRRFSW